MRARRQGAKAVLVYAAWGLRMEDTRVVSALARDHGGLVVGYFDFHAINSFSSQILPVMPAAIAGVMRSDP